MEKRNRIAVIQVVSVISAIVTPLLVAFFGYYNAQNIQSVKTGYDYAQFKLEKLQDAYEITNIALNTDLKESISSQLQDRHHIVREAWEMVNPYVSDRRLKEVRAANDIAERINQFYIESARAKQKGDDYTVSSTDEFGSLLYQYFDEVRAVVREEIRDTIEILDKSNR